ncbi:hypothetical protein CANARDRAFT_29794 [[Candida] arabinofermentans NRRL YB-2248]|uniref:Sorbose reductase SOU1 n=1 Tax=[Candida] arabinofermentans NRRL YB-2248 TaxID=983967 RepID=A0A1E4SVS5_9ASCO|nr:hypothetical protein CANARDRAFT_29794 [[Candida] arabinofermentans NRRL YB-2248]
MTKTFEDNVADTSYILNDLSPLPRPTPDLPPHVLDMFSLKDKVAVVTGAAQGIGYVVAEALAQAGASVAFWDLQDPTESAAKVAKETGVKCRSYQGDISNASSVEATVQQIEADFGRIDVFIANAGINIPSESCLGDNANRVWNKVIDVNLNGCFYCCREVGKIFKKQGSGSIVMTASMSAHIINTPMNQAAYNSSKAAVKHLSKSLAVEFAGFARVNSVSPGYIATTINDVLPMHFKKRWWSVIPMGREGHPRELVGAYLYLASNASTYTTGTDIVVDGAFTVC